MVYLSSRHVQFGKDTLIPYSQVEGFQGSKERKKWKNEQLKVQRLENTGNKKKKKKKIQETCSFL